MPVPPPRRKLSKENPPTSQNLASARGVSRLPRVISSTATKATPNSSDKAVTGPFVRNGSVRRTFTKEKELPKTGKEGTPRASKVNTQSRNDGNLVKNPLETRPSPDSNANGFVKKPAPKGAIASTHLPKQRSGSVKQENMVNSVLNGSVLNKSLGTDTSSLNLSNLQPSVCDSFDSEPSVTKDGSGVHARDSSADSNVQPRQNKLPTPKIQRVPSQNGVVPPARFNSRERLATPETRKLDLSSGSNAVPASAPPRKNFRIVRSVSSDEPNAEIKPNTKPSISESSLMIKPPLRPSRIGSKIPLSKNLTKSVSGGSLPLKNAGGAISASRLAPVQAKIHMVPGSVDGFTLRKSNAQTVAVDGRQTVKSAVVSGADKLWRTPSTRESPSEALRKQRLHNPVQRASSLRSSPRPVVTAEVKPEARSRSVGQAKPDQPKPPPAMAAEVDTQHLSVPAKLILVAQIATDETVQASSANSHAQQLISSSDESKSSSSGNLSSGAEIVCGTQMIGSSKPKTIPQPKAGKIPAVEVSLGRQSEFKPQLAFKPRVATQANSLSKAINHSSDLTKTSPIEKLGQVETTTTVSTSLSSTKRSNIVSSQPSGLLSEVDILTVNELEIDANYHPIEINRSNFLFSRRRQLKSEDTGSLEASTKRFSGLVAKKANRAREESKHELDLHRSEEKIVQSKPPRHQKPDLSFGHLTSDPGGCSTQGEILLLRASVLPASEYPDKTPVVLNHELVGCQNNSCPVEKMQQKPEQAQTNGMIELDQEVSFSEALSNDRQDGLRSLQTMEKRSQSCDRQCIGSEGKAKRETSLSEKPPIPKPARPSLLRRAASSSALLVKSGKPPKGFVNSEILIVKDDRTIVQIMTGKSPSDVFGKQSEGDTDVSSVADTNVEQCKAADDAVIVRLNSDVSEASNSTAVTNLMEARKADHPQIITRIPVPAQCEVEDILVRTELPKKQSGDIVVNDASCDIQFLPSSDNDICDMPPPGFSMCEFDTSTFMQKLTTPAKTFEHKNMRCVRSVDGSPSRSSSPAKSIREYETVYANIKRRNSEFTVENRNEIIYSNVRRGSDLSRTSSPMASSPMEYGVSPARYDTVRMGGDPSSVFIPPYPAYATPIEHEMVYATIPHRRKTPEVYELPRPYDGNIYATYRKARPDSHTKMNEHPRKVDFIQPVNQKELYYSSDSPSVQEVSRRSGLNPRHLIDSCDYAEFLDDEGSAPSEFSASEFAPRGFTPKARKAGHGLKAKILRKMSSMSKPKAETPVGTTYKRRTGETPNYATIPGRGHRNFNHSISRELLSKMEAERESIQGSSAPLEDFDDALEADFPDLAEAIRYERFNPPVLTNRLSRVDLVEDPAYQSAVMVIGGEKTVVPLFREPPSQEFHEEDDSRGGQDKYGQKERPHLKQSASFPWRTNNGNGNHVSDTSMGQSGKLVSKGQKNGEAGIDADATSLASLDNEMSRNKNFRSQSAWDLRRRLAKNNEAALPGEDSQSGDNRLKGDVDENTNSAFRFGPIAWRASKDRKRAKKAASNRTSKCNSGDSGIQVTRPPSADYECLGFVNEFPPTVAADSPEEKNRRSSPRHYPLGGSATAPQSPAEASIPLRTNQVPENYQEESCFGSGRLRRAVSQPLRNDQHEEKEIRRPSPEGCEVDFGVGYSSEDELESDHVPQHFKERALDPLSAREPQVPLDAVAQFDYTAEGPGEVKSSQETEETGNRSLQSSTQLRSNVVEEILRTERDYVKHLEDIVEGYQDQMRRRPDMFFHDQLETIFGNIEPLFDFQKRFLRDLEASYRKERPDQTCVGSCFLRHISSFDVYSYYCTRHDSAGKELQNLYANERTAQFLEACRLLRGMADILLDGFLLTPVQRICKYPLQLAELLKHTDENHCDHNDVSLALIAMREVVSQINERKRKLEGMERLADWQKMVENWQGDDLTLKSSECIYSGDVQKVSHGGWAKEFTLFLFDRQVIICKRDLIKRNSLSYKSRFSTENNCEALPVPDGKDAQYNTTVKFAFKVRESSDRCYLFTCKSQEDRDKWLAAFARERLLQQGEGLRSLPDGASFDSIRRLEGKPNKLANERQRLRHIKTRPRVKKIGPESVLSLQQVSLLEGPSIQVDTSRKNSWLSIGSSWSKKRVQQNRTSEV